MLKAEGRKVKGNYSQSTTCFELSALSFQLFYTIDLSVASSN